MKIITKNFKAKKFSDLHLGEVFRLKYCKSLYLKIKNCYIHPENIIRNSVDLETGEVYCFDDNDELSAVDTHVVADVSEFCPEDVAYTPFIPEDDLPKGYNPPPVRNVRKPKMPPPTKAKDK